jgi:hypothetical protein
MVKLMQVSFDFLRGVLGVLGVFFAYLAGRSGVHVRKGKAKLSGFYGWVLRAAACAIVVSVRHPLGVLDVAVWVAIAAAFACGWWIATRERPQEDLTEAMFPK